MCPANRFSKQPFRGKTTCLHLTGWKTMCIWWCPHLLCPRARFWVSCISNAILIFCSPLSARYKSGKKGMPTYWIKRGPLSPPWKLRKQKARKISAGNGPPIPMTSTYRNWALLNRKWLPGNEALEHILIRKTILFTSKAMPLFQEQTAGA